VEKYELEYPSSGRVPTRAHVGVVGSGDLEVLLEPSADGRAHVSIRTSVAGYGRIWKAVLDRFFSDYHDAARITVNDFGATPAVVLLRLRQAAEQAQ
jgi:malonate decarboxylase delta subunit